MADKCMFCKQNKPTNHLILYNNDWWIEFCKECGLKETLIDSHGAKITIQEIYDNSQIKTKIKKP
jgi:hypothetical protein